MAAAGESCFCLFFLYSALYLVITQSYSFIFSSLPQYSQDFPSIRDRLLPQPLHLRIEGAQTACVWQSSLFSRLMCKISFLPFIFVPLNSLSNKVALTVAICTPFSLLYESIDRDNVSISTTSRYFCRYPERSQSEKVLTWFFISAKWMV